MQRQKKDHADDENHQEKAPHSPARLSSVCLPIMFARSPQVRKGGIYLPAAGPSHTARYINEIECMVIFTYFNIL